MYALRFSHLKSQRQASWTCTHNGGEACAGGGLVAAAAYVAYVALINAAWLGTFWLGIATFPRSARSGSKLNKRARLTAQVPARPGWGPCTCCPSQPPFPCPTCLPWTGNPHAAERRRKLRRRCMGRRTRRALPLASRVPHRRQRRRRAAARHRQGLAAAGSRAGSLRRVCVWIRRGEQAAAGAARGAHLVCAWTGGGGTRQRCGHHPGVCNQRGAGGGRLGRMFEGCIGPHAAQASIQRSVAAQTAAAAAAPHCLPLAVRLPTDCRSFVAPFAGLRFLGRPV